MVNANSLLSLPPAKRQAWLASLTPEELAAINFDWPFWARPDQIEPPGEWTTWLILAGRGWGKTKTGAETVRGWAYSARYERIALVAETAADARDVIVEGNSGILRCSPPWFRPKYEPSKRRLTWPNGVVATLYSGEEPDQLRGPQHGAAWADEVAKWRYAQDAWDQLQFGLRLGDRPIQVVTTTPRPIPIIRSLLSDKHCFVTRGRTLDNARNLAPTFLEKIVARYQGTRLGRQELDAEVLDDIPGALWSRAIVEACRVQAAPPLKRIVVAIDPPATAGEEADECGIVVAGLGSDNQGYVIEDISERGLSPEKWARRAVIAYHRNEADHIVAEVNQGGDMVETIIRMIDPAVPVKKVHATRGKYVRAEPIAALYEQTRVHHVGSFAALEDQLCGFTVDGMADDSSPDRLDAMVWAMTELMLGHQDGLGIG